MGDEIYYRTRWKDQGESQDSWLRHSDFVDYGPIQQYEKDRLNGRLVTGEAIEKKSIGKLKVAKAGQRKMVNFDQQRIINQEMDQETKEALLELSVNVALDLDGDQLDAVSEYRRRMVKTRNRKLLWNQTQIRNVNEIRKRIKRRNMVC